MTDRSEAVAAYTTALMKPDEDSGLISSVLAEDVVVQTNFGRVEGLEAAVAFQREPRTAALSAAGAQWSQAAAVGDRVALTATSAPCAR